MSDNVQLSKKEEFCYNCGHDLSMHAYYSLLNGHVIIEYEPLVIQTVWMGFPIKMEMSVPYVKKGICPCARFISKYDVKYSEGLTPDV